MAFSIDMRGIKRESYRLIRQDGLSDICAGLMLAIAAVFFLEFKYAGALIVACSIQTIVLPICRRKITYPRVGYAKFPGRPDIKSFILWDIAIPLAVVGFIICTGIWVRQLLPVSLGIFLAALTFIGARITGYLRDHVLAGLFLASGFITLLFIWAGHNPGIATAYQLWFLSIILVPAGLIQLMFFLRHYHMPGKEAQNDSI